MLRVARELEAASRPTEPQQYLAVLPLGVLLENLGVYAALMAGACVQLYPQQQLGMGGASQVDFKRLLAAIALSGAQSLILVPQLLMGLVTAIERRLMGLAHCDSWPWAAPGYHPTCWLGPMQWACQYSKVMACPNAPRWLR